VPKPELPERLRDTVRRVGGWQALVNPSPDDYPHVQRRFYEEYRVWAATEQAAKALEGFEGFKRLATKIMMPALHAPCDDDQSAAD